MLLKSAYHKPFKSTLLCSAQRQSQDDAHTPVSGGRLAAGAGRSGCQWQQGPALPPLYNEHGPPAHTRSVAEMVLVTSFVGPRPVGHVVRFNDGTARTVSSIILEWAAAPAARDESAGKGNCDPPTC